MPVRNPKYIIEAQKEAAKKIINQRNRRQCNIEEDIIIEENQCCESNILLMEAITAVTALSTEQDDDCVVVGYSKNIELTEDDIARQREFLDNSVAPFYL